MKLWSNFPMSGLRTISPIYHQKKGKLFSIIEIEKLTLGLAGNQSSKKMPVEWNPPLTDQSVAISIQTIFPTVDLMPIPISVPI